jgi:hypothetical protein
MINVLTVVSVLFATAAMGFLGTAKAGRAPAEAEAEVQPQRAIPRRWSTLLIAMAVVYCILLLAGLSYAGWFRVA